MFSTSEKVSGLGDSGIRMSKSREILADPVALIGKSHWIITTQYDGTRSFRQLEQQVNERDPIPRLVYWLSARQQNDVKRGVRGVIGSADSGIPEEDAAGYGDANQFQKYHDQALTPFSKSCRRTKAHTA
jgi:hypothetical protein